MMSGDSTEKIRQRAYEMWEREGRPHGRDRIHWLRAEAEVRQGRPTAAEATPAASQPANQTKQKSRPGGRG